MRIGASSRLVVLLGDPVAHSMSPLMHNAAIATLGLDAVYVALKVPPVGIPHVIRACECAAIAGNVTIPHKLDVAGLLIRLTEPASALGAVNTFWPDGERLVGDNTDVGGVLDALDEIEAEGPWLVLGTGGGARAVAAAAKEREVTLLVGSRTLTRAQAFVEWARDLGLAECHVDDGRRIETVVNATPLGLASDDALPLSAERLDGATAALDLVYAPRATQWIRQCRERGLRAADGRTVLVAQGALAFERFFPGTTAPRTVMAAIVEGALDG
jgi:shikimate dehydrogenase